MSAVGELLFEQLEEIENLTTPTEAKQWARDTLEFMGIMGFNGVTPYNFWLDGEAESAKSIPDSVRRIQVNNSIKLLSSQSEQLRQDLNKFLNDEDLLENLALMKSQYKNLLDQVTQLDEGLKNVTGLNRLHIEEDEVKEEEKDLGKKRKPKDIPNIADEGERYVIEEDADGNEKITIVNNKTEEERKGFAEKIRDLAEFEADRKLNNEFARTWIINQKLDRMGLTEGERNIFWDEFHGQLHDASPAAIKKKIVNKVAEKYTTFKRAVRARVGRAIVDTADAIDLGLSRQVDKVRINRKRDPN